MTQPKYYSLQVFRIETNRQSDDGPIYVEVKIDKTVHRTGLIDTSGRPPWAGTLTFSDVHHSEIINIRLKRARKGLRDLRIGSIDASMRELLQEDNVRLDLGPVSAGIVLLRLKSVNAFERAEAEVSTAEEGVRQIGTLNSDFTDGVVGSVINALDGLVMAIDAAAELHSLFDVSWKAASALYKLVSHQFRTDAKLKEMVETMVEACKFSEKAKGLNDKTEGLEPIIRELLNEAVKCCKFVKKYASRSFFGRMARWRGRETIDGYIARFDDLRKDMDRAIALNIAKGVDNIDIQQKLATLMEPGKIDASISRVSSRPRCLPGTRKAYLDQISTSLFSDSGHNIVWLTGAAGSGKSTTAVTISDICEREDSRVAYLFFERGKDGFDSAIRAIAYRLATLDETIAPHIAKAINENIKGSTLKKQFEQLLLAPLKAAEHALAYPVIIVLDALDEYGTRQQREELVGLLKSDFGQLPSVIRLLVTSRPESVIMENLATSSHIHHIRLEHESENGRSDVADYLREEIISVVVKRPPGGRRENDVIQTPSDAAEGLFIWASTVVKMVKGSSNPGRKLETLLENTSLVGGGIDGLYAVVLEESGISWEERQTRDEFRRILGFILFAKESMSGDEMEAFLGLEKGVVDSILNRLRSVLSYEAGKPIRLHHASFADYISLPDRSGGKPRNVDEAELKKVIAERCFDVMNEELRFNICDIPTSFVRNDDIPGLVDRIKERISLHLDYACRLWSAHFCELVDPAGLLDRIEAFAHGHLLYWLEVLSLNKCVIYIAGGALRDACLKTAPIHANVSSFLWDAYRLVTVFSLPMSQSVPQIYLSAISLWREESCVADHYSRTHPVVLSKRFGKKMPAACLKVLGDRSLWTTSIAVSPDGRRLACGSRTGTIHIWDVDSGEIVSEQTITKRCGNKIQSVAFSPDGKRLVSGFADKMIRIWDVDSCQLVSGPFEGHTDSINSVAFSPSGKCIVSGSEDIRVWNSITGELILGPLRVQSGRVLSVAFSPDGRCIASGSTDGLVRIWDADSGQLVLRPLEGHTGQVCSIAFSYDSRCIVSGSSDKTIRIWNVDNGQLVAGPFTRHTEMVLSVAFSPDGKHVVSSSEDKTICIWNADSGSLVSGPFEGRTSHINQATFLPDGKRIVSVYSVELIRIWDAYSGRLDRSSPEGHLRQIDAVTFHPDRERVVSGSVDGSIRIWACGHDYLPLSVLKGHTSAIASIAVSPDGKRLASGSRDRTIRMWDLETGHSVCGPLEGHSDVVEEIAFSPDGKRIISGSRDTSVRIWDAETGQLVLGPLWLGHKDTILSVAFAPDGKRAASGAGDGTSCILDVETRRIVSKCLIYEFHAMSIVFLSDGRCLAAGTNGRKVRIWDAGTRKLFLTLRDLPGEVCSVAFSPDGMRIATGSSTICIWDAVTGAALKKFEGHTLPIWTIAFSSDGRYIVSGSEDETVRVWETGDEEASTVFDKASASRTEGVSTARNSQEVTTDWRLDNGWIIDTRGRLLTWIPEDMRATLWRPQNVACFAEFSMRLDIANSPLGENWCKGYPKSC